MTKIEEAMYAPGVAAAIGNHVIPAIHAAISIHGILTADPVRFAAILSEEAGEVAAAALGVSREPRTSSYEHLRDELAQVAAVAILAIAGIHPARLDEDFHR